jgi:hypothetical protein
MTLCGLVNRYQRSRGAYCLQFQDKKHPATIHHVPEDSNLNIHRHKKLRSHNPHIPLIYTELYYI